MSEWEVQVIHDHAGTPVAMIEVKASHDSLNEQLQALRGVDESLGHLRSLGNGIADVCRQVMESAQNGLGDLAPDELQLTFGVSLMAEGGLPLIARTSGEATLGVAATWRRTTAPT